MPNWPKRYKKTKTKPISSLFQGREDEKCRQEKCGKTEELEADLVDVRKEDKTIRPFAIPSQPEIVGNILKISSYTTIKKHPSAKHGTGKPVSRKS